MSPTPIFHGHMSDDGKLELAESERDRRRAYFQYLAGKDIEIVIRKERTQRSIDQNAYLHAGPFPILAEHCGNTLAEIKFELMGACWGWKTLQSGHVVPVKIHTADMTVEECTKFIDWLMPFALETFGVQLPLPHEVAA